MRPTTIRVRSCVGWIELSAWYGQDPQTGTWLCPMRERWGLGPHARMTPELEERLCYTATVAGSYEAAAALAARWGAPVDDATIQCHVQQAGERVQAAHAARVERALAVETRGEVVAEAAEQAPQDFALAIMMDGWMARERGPDWGLKPPEKQGDRAAWHEMKTAVVFRLDQRARSQSGRAMVVEKFFEAWRGEPFELGRRVYALALRQGLNQARHVYVISDGAAWIWNIVEDRLQPATQVVDFYHVVQHLWAVARELHGADETAAWRWIRPLLHGLRHGEEQRVVRQLERLLLRAPGEDLRREVGYFVGHRERLHYRTVAQRGAPIGSGAVESACAQLQGRLKGPGKFWSRAGKNHLLELDLARRNGDWDEDFWYQAA